MEGRGRTITRNHSVMTFIFPEEKEYIINFLRFIKEYKHAKIESISSEEIKCILIYASSKYLSMMDTYYVKKYKKSPSFIINRTQINNKSNVIIIVVYVWFSYDDVYACVFLYDAYDDGV